MHEEVRLARTGGTSKATVDALALTLRAQNEKQRPIHTTRRNHPRRMALISLLTEFSQAACRGSRP
jgi:hypothetical protein